MRHFFINSISLLLVLLFSAKILNATAIADTVNLTEKTSNSKYSKWAQEEINAANTAANIAELTNAEKETILYINLARLYPKKFAKVEVENYYGGEKYGNYVKTSPYRFSLIETLNSMESTKAMAFDYSTHEYAKCFAKESGENGTTGHNRIGCSEITGGSAECCSYGMDNGLEIALQWLIDHNVPSLGHRINCLNPIYTKIGVSVHSHTHYKICAVADMIW